MLGARTSFSTDRAALRVYVRFHGTSATPCRWLAKRAATKPRASIALPLPQTRASQKPGWQFRRQHAAAFPGVATSALTIASSDWALDVLLRKGGSGYLPRRHVAPYLADGRLLARADAPPFRRRVYVVETAETVRNWAWYPEALAAASHAAA